MRFSSKSGEVTSDIGTVSKDVPLSVTNNSSTVGLMAADVDEKDKSAKRDSFWKRYVDSFKPMEESEKANLDLGAHGHGGGDHSSSEGGLKRTLKSRHMQMIAIGGAIGTGLFIGSGGVLALGGPCSLILGFMFVGAMLFNVIMALGEMAVLFPIQGSFSVYSSRFIDPAWGFAMGWNYALQWLVVLPLELTACAMTIEYWGHSVSTSVWITVFLVVVVVINFFGVKGYAEAEFLFSAVKVTAVIGFIILGVVINVGGGPKGKWYGTRTWTDPGAFNNGFLGFCSVFVTAAFAFAGTELVGLAAAESAQPRKTLPKATKQVFWRVCIFYVVNLLLVGFIVPFDHPSLLNNGNNTKSAAASPFVIAIKDAGIDILPSIFNAVILVSVLSVGNSAVYGSSRTLCALAQIGQVPKFLGYIDRQGRPMAAIILALLLGLLAYLNESAHKDAIFHWLLAISGLSTIFTWMSISWAHLRFRRAWRLQGHTLDELPFRAAGGVIGSWFGLIANILILAAQFYVAVRPIKHEPSAERFFEAYLATPIILVFYIVWKLIKRTPFMVTQKDHNRPQHWLFKTEEMDLVTGRRDMNLKAILEKEREELAAQPVWKRLYVGCCG